MVDLQTVLTYLTLISVPVGVFYHIMTLNNTRKNQLLTLETRQAQLFMNISNKFHSDEMTESFFEILNMEYTDADDFLEKYGLEHKGIQRYTNFLESLGVMVKEGYIDIRPIAILFGGDLQAAWVKLKPMIYGVREKLGYPRFAIETEYLYDTFKEYSEKHPELELTRIEIES